MLGRLPTSTKGSIRVEAQEWDSIDILKKLLLLLYEEWIIGGKEWKQGDQLEDPSLH